MLCIRIEKLGAQLATLGALIDRYERNDLGFPAAALSWLKDAESLLASLRLPADAAEVAGLRGRVSATSERAERGVTKGASVGSARARLRRHRSAAAASSLELAGARMRERIRDASARLLHFEEKLIEACTAGALVGALPLPPTRPWETWLASAWRALASHKATRPTTLYISAALASPDRLYLLDQVLSRMLETRMPVLEHAGEPAARPATRRVGTSS